MFASLVCTIEFLPRVPIHCNVATDEVKVLCNHIGNVIFVLCSSALLKTLLNYIEDSYLNYIEDSY